MWPAGGLGDRGTGLWEEAGWSRKSCAKGHTKLTALESVWQCKAEARLCRGWGPLQLVRIEAGHLLAVMEMDTALDPLLLHRDVSCRWLLIHYREDLRPRTCPADDS